MAKSRPGSGPGGPSAAGPGSGGSAAAQAPWQIRLSDPETGQVLGAGFRIAPRLALTCWHVVAGYRDRGARVALTGPAGWSGTIQPGDLEEAAQGTDVAMLRLPASVPDGVAAPIQTITMAAAIHFVIEAFRSFSNVTLAFNSCHGFR